MIPKESIQHRLERLQQYSQHYLIEDIDDPALMDKTLISLFERDRLHHYIYLLTYSKTTKRKSEQISFKEEYLKVDRLQFLEIANGLIDNQNRLERIYHIIGQRRFGAGKSTLNTYLIEPNRDLSWAKELFGSQKTDPLHGHFNSQHFYFEKKDKNRNVYEGILISTGQEQYIYIHQKNISPKKVIEREFLIELDQTIYNLINNSSMVSRKIELAFIQMGRLRFMHQTPTTQSITDLSEEEIWQTLKNRKTEARHTFLQQRFGGIDKIDLQQQKAELKQCYFDLYRLSLEYVKSPSSSLSSKLASELKHFASFFSQQPPMDDIVTYITALIILCHDGDLAEVIGESKRFVQVYISLIENFGEWLNDLLDEQGPQDVHEKICSMVDITESLKYTLHIFGDAKQNDVEDGRSNQDIESPPITSKAVISAKQFAKEVEIDQEIMDELEELEEDINDVLEYRAYIDEKILRHVGVFFSEYNRMLGTLLEFEEIGYGMSVLLNQMKKAKIDNYSQQQKEQLYVMIKALVKDLENWKQAVFTEKKAADIHYMDVSFKISIQQISYIIDPEHNLPAGDVEMF